MRRKTEVLFLIAILMLISCQQLYVIYVTNPVAGVTASDYWSQIIAMRQISSEHKLNYDMSWTNIFRTEGAYKYYPPGFPLIINTAQELTGLGYLELSFVSTIFWILFCISIYLIARKITGKGEVGLLAAFCGATFISGANMLGPMYPLPSNLSVSLMLMVILTITVINKNIYKVIIGTLLIFGIFSSHRPSIVAWLFILPIISLIPMLFIKNRMAFIFNLNFPLIFATIFGALISFIFWLNLPMDAIMTLGGILNKRVDVSIFHQELNIQALIALLVLAILVIVLIYIALSSWFAASLNEVGPIISIKIPRWQTTIMMLSFPIILLLLMVFVAINMGIGIPYTPNALVRLWDQISIASHGNQFTESIKQGLYAWHFNIISIIMFVPAGYLILRGCRRNNLLQASFAAIFSLAICFAIGDTFGQFKIQRMYFYIAPFMAIVSGWGAYVFLNNKRKWMKYFIAFSVVGAIMVSAYSIPYNSEYTSTIDVNGILWEISTKSISSQIATSSYPTLISRGFGDMGYTVYYSVLMSESHSDMVQLMKNEGIHGLFISEDNAAMRSLASGPLSTLIYINGGCSIWII